MLPISKDDRLIDVHERVTRIETKLDMVLESVVPQVEKNTKFRHITTGIWSFILAVGGAVGGYLMIWR